MERGNTVITEANFSTYLRHIIAYKFDETNISARIAAYRELDALFRMKDTEEIVQCVQNNLSILLRLIEADLSNETSEGRQWALRTLSYVTFHEALVEHISKNQRERFLTMLTQLIDAAGCEVHTFIFLHFSF